jgi:pseudouridine synthase
MPVRVRLNKYLRNCGLASRRKSEGLVEEGRVKVNGTTVTQVATLVDPQADEVRVDGEVVRPVGKTVYLAVYKPRGVVVTASDPRGRTTVFEAVKGLPEGVFSVGRLDMESEGLLLMTNDGKLAFRLTHPRYGIERRYEVTVRGRLGEGAIESLIEGVQLEDGRARAVSAWVLEKEGGRTRIGLTLTEGRKREIRRMLAALGYEVLELVRVSFGGVPLGDLEPGGWRRLERDEVRGLRRRVEESYLRAKERGTGEEAGGDH